jgi:TRAP-type mannitol/chloroaromatic compound transport system permease small subunit
VTQKMEPLLLLIDRLNERVGRIVAFFVLAMVGFIVYEVICRYLFNRPTMWVHETSELIFGAYFLLGGGYSLLRKQHVNVDIFVKDLKGKNKLLIELFSSFLIFVFCGMLLWKGGEMAWDSLKILEYSQTIWGPPIYPVKLTIPIGALFLLLQAIAQFLRNLNVFFKERNQG